MELHDTGSSATGETHPLADGEGVHTVNDAAREAAEASVTAIAAALSVADQIAAADEAYGKCARAYARARDGGASIRQPAAEVVAAAQQAGINPAAARAAGMPLPTSTAAIEGTAWAGRLLALPGQSPIPCRSLIRMATRVYNSHGGAQHLTSITSEAPDIADAVQRLRDAQAQTRSDHAKPGTRESIDPDDPEAVLDMAIKCLAVVDLLARAGRLEPGPPTNSRVAHAWRHLASIDAHMWDREEGNGIDI